MSSTIQYRTKSKKNFSVFIPEPVARQAIGALMIPSLAVSDSCHERKISWLATSFAWYGFHHEPSNMLSVERYRFGSCPKAFPGREVSANHKARKEMSHALTSKLCQIILFVIPFLTGCWAGKHEKELGGKDAQREPDAVTWAKWEANPEPYGGLETLREIKRAKRAKASVLHLADRKIRDLSPLASLTDLEALYLGLNEIEDVSPLAGLSNLTYLNLYANQVSDVTPLSGLNGLDTLFLDRNKITKITPLAKLSKLEWLAVRENPLAKGEADAIRKALPDCELKD